MSSLHFAKAENGVARLTLAGHSWPMPLTFSEALVKAQSLPLKLAAFSTALQLFNSAFNFVLRISGVLLAVFLIHQLFFWLSKDPEKAFNFAALVLDVNRESLGICYRFSTTRLPTSSTAPSLPFGTPLRSTSSNRP